MAKQQRTSRYREDLLDTAEWLRKKKCPHRDKFMSGKRIRPKNITGKEKLADLVDETFLAYNGARLKEGCQFFANRIRPFQVTGRQAFCLQCLSCLLK
jgi:hypothetical protein